ncbi:MAG: SCO family protein [Bacteroidetes bacterium]|nr:SCO family protein [Bacteroidota bacterium]
MSSRAKSILITFFIIGIPVLFMFMMKCGRTVYKQLPHLGDIKGIAANGDTLFHTIDDFEFVDQQNQKVTNKNFEGCIYVANYFFATCPDVCPRMNANLQRVYDRYKDNPKVKFISHTVDPEHDVPEVLFNYAKNLNVDPAKWYFVTGNKDSLYNLAQRSYLIRAGEGDAKPISFIHDETFILVDQNRYIRATFDGLAPEKMDELIDAIQLLLTDMKK